MALSYYTNSEDVNNNFYLPPAPAPAQIELQTDLLCCTNDNFDYFPEILTNNDDHNSDSFYFDETYNYNNNSNNPLPPLPIELQQQVFDPFFINYPKRQKHEYDCYQNIYSDLFKPALFNGSNSYSTTLLPDFDFVSLPLVENENVKVKKQSLSSQSIAARQRRRKITEKTQELGKLIPGGGKLNTAEMLQSAYKYVKYLQAQVGILELMATHNSQEKCEEFNGLIESSLVQEKLYSNEKCLVPEKFVQELSHFDNKFEFKAQILKEVRQLIPSKEED